MPIPLALGGGGIILFDHQTPVRVQGYNPSIGTNEYQLILGAVAYIHPRTRQQYHIIVHQAVHITDLDHHLIQVYMNNIIVNNCPKFLCQNPTTQSHAIAGQDKYGNDFTLPLTLNGVTSYLPVKSLSQRKWDNKNHLGSS